MAIESRWKDPGVRKIEKAWCNLFHRRPSDLGSSCGETYEWAIAEAHTLGEARTDKCWCRTVNDAVDHFNNTASAHRVRVRASADGAGGVILRRY